MTAQESDHRIRVARERRDRMRARLLAAIMACSTRSQSASVTVEDVVREADVSRATFYKYFPSVEGATSELGRNLVDEMVHSFIAVFDGPEGPFFRMTVGIQIFLLRSAADRQWADFVSRSDYLARDTDLLKGITMHLAQARDQGLVEFVNLEAASSMVVGTLMEGIRHIARSGQRSRAYIEELIVTILRGLAVDEAQAREVVQDRAVFIRELAPQRLIWWQDPWAAEG